MNNIRQSAWFKKINDPFGKFIVGASFALMLSLVWSIGMLVVTKNCPEHGWRWIRHHMTYGAVHHIFFPVACGLLLASVRIEVLRSTGKTLWAVLVALLALCTLVTVDDARGRDQAYEANPACKWLSIEAPLRSIEEARRTQLSPDPRRFDGLQKGLDELQRSSWYAEQVTIWRASSSDDEGMPSISRAGVTPTPKDLLLENLSGRSPADANFVGKAAILLTWFFLCFVAFFAWYTIAASFQPTFDNELRFQLGCVLVLLTTWIPARVYANWYQDWWHAGANIDNSTAVVASVVAVVILGYLVAVGLLKNRVSFETAVYVGGLVVSVTGFLLTKYSGWLERVERSIDNSRPSLLILEVFIVLLFAVSLVRLALVKPQGNLRRGAKGR